jgi:hypothetical protein
VADITKFPGIPVKPRLARCTGPVPRFSDKYGSERCGRCGLLKPSCGCAFLSDEQASRTLNRAREKAGLPSENPDAPHVRLDGLRKRTGKPLSLPADLVDGDALERAGFGRGIPHARDDARRRELRELRQRADSMAEAAGSLEIAARLLRTEAETISRRLDQMGGEEGGLRPIGEFAGNLVRQIREEQACGDEPDGAA